MQTCKPICITNWKAIKFKSSYTGKTDGWGLCHLNDDEVIRYLQNMYT